MAYFKVLSRHSPAEIERTHKIPQDRHSHEFQTGYLPSTNVECYRYTNLLSAVSISQEDKMKEQGWNQAV